MYDVLLAKAMKLRKIRFVASLVQLRTNQNVVCRLFVDATLHLQALVERYGSFESLLAVPDDKLKGVLVETNASEEETGKLISALKHLREFTGTLNNSGKRETTCSSTYRGDTDGDLYV